MNKNRMLSTDGETNSTVAARRRSNKDERLTGSQKEKYTRMIDPFPRKSVFYFGRLGAMEHENE
jgi:hypothetical protein